jgi:predicted PurR-regulated permease PerM
MDQQDNRDIHSISKILWLAGITLVVLVILFLMSKILQFLLIIFAGILLAIFLNGMANYVKRKTPLTYGLSLFAVTFISTIIILGTGFLIGPRIADQLVILFDKIPTAIDTFLGLLKENKWMQAIFKGKEQLMPPGNEILGEVTGFFSNLFDMIIMVIIILFVGIYLAANPQKYIRGILTLLPKNGRNRIEELFHALHSCLLRWITGAIVSMIVSGVLAAIGFSLIGLPLALILALIISFFAFIPYLGPVFAIIPVLLVALSEKPVIVLYAFTLYFFIEILESYEITPKIQKKVIYLPPAVLISIQILLTFLAGFLGLLLAAPLTVVIIVTIQVLYIKYYLGVSDDRIEVEGKGENRKTRSKH